MAAVSRPWPFTRPSLLKGILRVPFLHPWAGSKGRVRVGAGTSEFARAWALLLVDTHTFVLLQLFRSQERFVFRLNKRVTLWGEGSSLRTCLMRGGPTEVSSSGATTPEALLLKGGTKSSDVLHLDADVTLSWFIWHLWLG